MRHTHKLGGGGSIGETQTQWIDHPAIISHIRCKTRVNMNLVHSKQTLT